MSVLENIPQGTNSTTKARAIYNITLLLFGSMSSLQESIRSFDLRIGRKEGLCLRCGLNFESLRVVGQVGLVHSGEVADLILSHICSWARAGVETFGKLGLRGDTEAEACW